MRQQQLGCMVLTCFNFLLLVFVSILTASFYGVKRFILRTTATESEADLHKDFQIPKYSQSIINLLRTHHVQPAAILNTYHDIDVCFWRDLIYRAKLHEDSL